MERLGNIESDVKKIESVEDMAEEIQAERLDPENFRGHKFYPDAEIDEDVALATKLEGKFDQQNQTRSLEQKAQLDRGIAAEFTLRHVMENYGWLAEKVNMIVTSKYDDFVRGIDSVAQIVLGEGRFEHLGFAIDFATGLEDVGNKLASTFDQLDKGYMPSVKYFESEQTGILKNFKMPKIVVGAGHETLQRLANLSTEITSDAGISESAKDELRNDTFRFVLFGEIEAQLGVFINRLKKVVEKAQAEKQYDIEKRALNALDIHENALRVIQDLALKIGADLSSIQKHIRGDAFAEKMGSALSVLSLTPIDFEPRKNKSK